MMLRTVRLCSVLLLSVSLAGPVSSRITKAPVQNIPAAAESAASLSRAPVPSLNLSPLKVDQESCARAAFAATGAGNWAGARSGLSCATDEAVRSAIMWRIAIGDSKASFQELDAALSLPGQWPREESTRAKAAAALAAASPAERVRWYERQRSLTADQRAQLALALREAGNPSKALAEARTALADSTLSIESGDTLLAAFLTALPAADLQKRAEALAWQREFDRAGRLAGSLDAKTRERLTAWSAIAVNRNASTYQALSGPLQQHPGLMLAEVQRRRLAGDSAGAIALAATIDPLQAPESARTAIAIERRRNASAALNAGDAQAAYRLVSATGLDRGETYADAEWMAGWLALQKLNNPNIARDHFQRLTERVSTPVSLSRGYYWLSQAERALGQAASADAAARQAAAFNFTFYGQLSGNSSSAVDVQPATISLVSSMADRTALQTMMRALVWAGQSNDGVAVRALAPVIASAVETPQDIAQLAAVLRANDQPAVAIRAAKAGARRGVFALDANYPLMRINDRALAAGPEPALIMAIARQESELDPRVVSPAGARGLMQVMPATAQQVSRSVGERYALGRLTAEPDYNVLLGSAYLTQMLREFDGSYVLAIAAYNAGPNRVKQWIGQYGDPRLKTVDTIDWVESIPFGETRNYVQRVLENVQVYRQRLNPAASGMLASDLERGGRG